MPIHTHKRAVPRIGIDTRPVDEAERVGLGVAAGNGIVVAVPVVVKPGLDLIELAGEAHIQRERTRDGKCLAPRTPGSLPDDGLGAVGDQNRSRQMVRAYHPGRCRSAGHPARHIPWWCCRWRHRLRQSDGHRDRRCNAPCLTGRPVPQSTG